MGDRDPWTYFLIKRHRIAPGTGGQAHDPRVWSAVPIPGVPDRGGRSHAGPGGEDDMGNLVPGPDGSEDPARAGAEVEPPQPAGRRYTRRRALTLGGAA